jgi:glycosyltransferase involved in cell wall biosynthesis
MTRQLVSILIPAYNASRWIHESIRSAVNQTWFAKEIIVIDDGSTDGTANIVRHYESAILKFAVQDNQGAARARNRALSLAQGDYIQWLDADDLLSPDKVERQMKVAKESSPRVILSSSFGKFHVCPESLGGHPKPASHGHLKTGQ